MKDIIILIRKRKHIPSNNFLIILVETFKRFSRRHMLFRCMIIIAYFFVGNVLNAPFEKITA